MASFLSRAGAAQQQPSRPMRGNAQLLAVRRQLFIHKFQKNRHDKPSYSGFSASVTILPTSLVRPMSTTGMLWFAMLDMDCGKMFTLFLIGVVLMTGLAALPTRDSITAGIYVSYRVSSAADSYQNAQLVFSMMIPALIPARSDSSLGLSRSHSRCA